MKIPFGIKKTRFTWVGLGAAAFSVTALTLLLSTGGCSQVDGSRCNPYLSHDECDNAPTVQCVTPAGTGDSYCCTVSAGAVASTINPGVLYVNGSPGGTITDSNQNCQTIGPPGSEGQTCPLGAPCWTSAGCTPFPAGTSSCPTGDDGGSDDASDAETTSDAAPTSDAGEAGAVSEAGTVSEASTPEEASVEASTTPEASVEASTSSDATPD
jgi:hypothetical protein